VLNLPRNEKKAAKAAADDLDARITARKITYKNLLAGEKDEAEMAHDVPETAHKAIDLPSTLKPSVRSRFELRNRV